MSGTHFENMNRQLAPLKNAIHVATIKKIQYCVEYTRFVVVSWAIHHDQLC